MNLARLRILLLANLSAALAVGCYSPALGLVTLFGACVLCAPFAQSRCSFVDPSGTKTDGSIPFGSQSVTISSVAYVVENVTITDGSRTIEQNNEYGVPTKQAFIDTVAEISGTLQLATDTTALPAKYATLPLKPHPISTASAINFIITELGQTFDHMNEIKVPFKARKKLN